MKIDISGRHFKVTGPLQDYIDSKVQKLDKYSLKIESAHVVLEVQKFRYIAEITLRGKDLRLVAKDEDGEMYAAFDRCFGRAQLQLSRKHDRRRDHKGRRYTAAGAREKKV